MELSFKKNGNTKRARRPQRLSWPVGFNRTSDNAPESRKRPRKANDSSLWVDSFAPRYSAELCIAPKKVKECKAWLEEATAPCTFPHSKKFLTLVGGPGIGKSTMVRVLCRELGINIHSWNESFIPRVQGVTMDKTFNLEHTSALDSFEEFLGHSGAGFSSLQLSTQQCNTQSIILLEDLPNLHGLEMKERFREFMSSHLSRTQVPTVLIFSDVVEGKHNPADLESLIDPLNLYASTTTICQIQPVTKLKMKKILEKIAKEKRRQLPPTFSEELHLQSGGDLRNAIMTLQLHFTASRLIPLPASGVHNKRDKKLSTFHSLGKLLYGKREINEQGNKVLAYDPESILARSDFGIGGSLRFLEYHSLDFFTDIEDVGFAYSSFSDAALFLDTTESNESYQENALFPDRCASSIAGRTMAIMNKHPAPNRFRSFATPKVFDVIRKRRQNNQLLFQLAQRLSNSHLGVFNAASGSTAFLTELLPFMRIIQPNEVNPTVDNFYSIAQETVKNQMNDTSKDQALLKVQDEILDEDDIEDFESDIENENKPHITELTTKAQPNALVCSEKDENKDSSNKMKTKPSNMAGAMPRVTSLSEPEIITID